MQTEDKNRLKKLMEQSLKEWNEPVSPDPEVDQIVAGWKTKLNDRILSQHPESGSALQANKPVKKLAFIRYAAVWTGLVLLAGLATWQFTKTDQADTIALVHQINKHGQPVKYLLPDNSEVYLAAGSRVSYPKNFEGNTREITLEGEAFFQVKPDKLKPFIVHTGNIQTRVLGTSFKINSFSNQQLVVSVATGKVGVSKQGDAKTETLALLTPGQKVTWNGETGKAVQGLVDIYSLEQWKAGEMVFDDQSIEFIAAELQRRYNISVEFVDKEIQNNKVSGTFPSGKSIDQVMTALAMAGKFHFETEDHKNFKIFNTSKLPM